MPRGLEIILDGGCERSVLYVPGGKGLLGGYGLKYPEEASPPLHGGSWCLGLDEVEGFGDCVDLVWGDSH